MLKLEKYCSIKPVLATRVNLMWPQRWLHAWISASQIISIIVTFEEILLLWGPLIGLSMTAPDTLVQTVQIRRDQRTHLLCDMIMSNLNQWLLHHMSNIGRSKVLLKHRVSPGSTPQTTATNTSMLWYWFFIDHNFQDHHGQNEFCVHLHWAYTKPLPLSLGHEWYI